MRPWWWYNILKLPCLLACLLFAGGLPGCKQQKKLLLAGCFVAATTSRNCHDHQQQLNSRGGGRGANKQFLWRSDTEKRRIRTSKHLCDYEDNDAELVFEALSTEIGESSVPAPEDLGYKSKVIKDSIYSEVNIDEVVDQCIHLSATQKEDLRSTSGFAFQQSEINRQIYLPKLADFTP